MEVFRLFGTISINKAKALADLNAVNARGATVGTKLGNVFRTIGKVAKVAFAAVAIAAGAMFVGAIKSAAEFEQAMAMVKAVTGATGAEFDELTAKSKQLGRDTKFSMVEIAEGMEALGRAGFTANEIIASMDGVTALAASQMVSLGEASEITANMIRQFGLEAADADRVANLLAAAAASSNTTVGSLAESMKFFGPIAKAMGMSIEEAVAAVGKLGDAGLKGGIATRALQTSLQGLAAPADDAKELMEELGLAFFDANGEFVGLDGAIAQLEVGFAGLNQQQQLAAMTTLFGSGAVKQFSNLLGVGSEELAAYTAEITGTTAAYDQMAIQLDTLSGQWTIAKGSVSLLLQTLGESMMPVLKNLLKNHIIPLINKTQLWVEKMGGIVGIVDLVKSKMLEWSNAHPVLIDALNGLKDVAVGVWDFFVNVFQGDWTDAWGSMQTIAEGAAKVIVAVWDGLKSAAVGMWEALPIPDAIKQKIEEVVRTVFGFVKEKAQEAWEGIRESTEENAPGIITAWESLKDSGSRLWESIISLFSSAGESTISFRDVVKGAFDVILTVVTTTLGGIADLFDVFSSLLRGDWSQAWTDFKDFIAGIWEGIKHILDVTGLWDIGANMAHAIRDGVASAWDSVVTLFQNAWDGIVAGATQFIDRIKETLSSISAFFASELEKTKDLFRPMAEWFSSEWAKTEEVFGRLSVWFAAELEKTKALFRPMVDWFAGEWAKTVDVFKTGWSSVHDFFAIAVPEWGRNIIQWMKDGLSSSWNSVVAWFQSAWDELLNALTSWMPEFMKKWLGVGEDSGQAYADGLESKKSTVAAAADDVGQAAVAAIELTQSQIEDMVQDLTDTFSKLTNSAEDLETASDVLTMGINRVGAELNSLVENGGMSIITLSEISAEMDELNRAVAELPVEEMEAAWRDGVESILEEWSGIVPGITKILDAVVGEASAKGEEVGNATIDGAVKGLNESAPDLDRAATEAAERIPNAFNILLDIQSPSKVMEKIGEQTNDGFVLGLVKTGRKIVKAGQKIIDDLKAEAEKSAADAGESTGEAYAEATADAIADGADAVGDAVGTVAEAISADAERMDAVIDLIGDDVKTLGDSLDELEKALASSESGSYEYSKALQELARFHEDLITAAEYLTDNNIEVVDSLETLIKQTDKYADASGEAAEEAQRLADAQEEAERKAKSFAQTLTRYVMKGVNAVIDGFKKMRQESKDLQDSLNDIEESYADAMDSAYDASGEDAEDEALRHKRNMEDIETDYQRKIDELRNKTFEDDEARRQAELAATMDYNQDIQDETTRHNRILEDIETDYNKAVEDAKQERIDDRAEEQQDFRENATTIGTIFRDLKDDIVETLLSEGLNNAFMGIISKLVGIKVEGETAFSSLTTWASNAATSLSTSLGGIAAALWPVMAALAVIGIGTSSAVADAVANANQFITEEILGQQYGSGMLVNGVPIEQAIANDPSIADLYANSPTYGSAQTESAGSSTKNVNVDMRGMYDGANINVRSDADVEALARKNYELFNSRLSERGIK